MTYVSESECATHYTSAPHNEENEVRGYKHQENNKHQIVWCREFSFFAPSHQINSSSSDHWLKYSSQQLLPPRLPQRWQKRLPTSTAASETDIVDNWQSHRYQLYRLSWFAYFSMTLFLESNGMTVMSGCDSVSLNICWFTVVFVIFLSFHSQYDAASNDRHCIQTTDCD